MSTTQTITRNLGGDRLGSGAKNNISLHNYNRSTHDLSRAWRSTMNCGTLVPCFKELALNGDTWSIDIETIVKTIPTITPLYGSYKLQIDFFECPIRLYNGLLHNNMTKIGLNMAQVKLPKIKLKHRIYNRENYFTELQQISNSALVKYLGISGIADMEFDHGQTYIDVERKFNAVPILAYYDIYKNYYTNKQEEKGVIIDCDERSGEYSKCEYIKFGVPAQIQGEEFGTIDTIVRFGEQLATTEEMQTAGAEGDTYQETNQLVTLNNYKYSIKFDNMQLVEDIQFLIGTDYVALTDSFPNATYNEATRVISLNEPALQYVGEKLKAIIYNATGTSNVGEIIKLKTFNLQNLDNARISILQNTGLNNELNLSDLDYPYSELTKVDNIGRTKNYYPQFGLAVKTYQSDLLNNWLQTEWIDGENGINTITAIDVSSGSFTIDALNLANKVYNMLNRIAVSGGTYEDWQEAVYTVKANRRAETPVYKGGYAAEIVFEEVVSQAATEKQPLGTLAGKGNIRGMRGGRIEIHCDEPCYIIGIASITPRIDYSQGNDWDMSELDTLNDVHKPQLDGIGFEDLLQERAAWFGTYYDHANEKFVKLAMGKVPAWINYMTSVNKTFGDFADEDKLMIMTLNRRYERRSISIDDMQPMGSNVMGIDDVTTYIDPSKYNYTFADASLASQNFWIQIGFRTEARRVMSAKVIPNL